MFGKLGEVGNRGFTALKFMRYDLMEADWNNRSAIEKSDPNTIKEIVNYWNNATGASNVKIPKLANILLFAPRLLSTTVKAIGQPFRASEIYTRWNSATPSEKYFANQTTKRLGSALAVYLGALAINQGILSATGSNKKINFFNPNSSDWLRFKAGDKTIDLSGGIIPSVRFIENLLVGSVVAIYYGRKQQYKPAENLAINLLTQARYKASPFVTSVLDPTLFGADAFGRPTPFSKVPPKYKDQIPYPSNIKGVT